MRMNMELFLNKVKKLAEMAWLQDAIKIKCVNLQPLSRVDSI